MESWRDGKRIYVSWPIAPNQFVPARKLPGAPTLVTPQSKAKYKRAVDSSTFGWVVVFANCDSAANENFCINNLGLTDCEKQLFFSVALYLAEYNTFNFIFQNPAGFEAMCVASYANIPPSSFWDELPQDERLCRGLLGGRVGSIMVAYDNPVFRVTLIR
jgi:hypothetical protein